jgi:hypothetical protein
MARLIPPVISKYTKSPGERSCFQILRDDPATTAWTVIHSWDIANHPKQICGEADLICIIPNLGVLCVEIKANSSVCRRADGIWELGQTRDQDGPFKQAADARFATWAYVSKINPGLRGIVFWSCVIFTEVEFSQQSGEWHSWQVISKSDIATLGLSRSLVRVLTQARKLLETSPTAGWFRYNRNRPTEADAGQIIDILRPYFEFFQSPRARLDEAERELKLFTEGQFAALDRMDRNPRIAFIGPAGCGKSLLALEAARRSAVAGKKTLLICYNRLFSQWLKREAAPLGDQVKAGSFHSLLLEMTGADTVGADSRFWAKTLPELAIRALTDGGHAIYDKLIIDEAQDLLTSPFIDCLDLLITGGLLGGQFYLFGDFENQTVFRHSVISIGDFRSGFVPDLSIYRLDENCRNRPRVGNAAQLLGRMHHGYSRYLREDDRVDPIIKYFANEKQCYEHLRWAITDARTKGFHPQETVVLLPAALYSDSVSYQNGNIHLASYTTGQGLPANCDAWHSTVRRFKGLESRAIILVGLDDIISEDGADLFYTACTRTTDVFYFVVRQNIKAQLERVITNRM